LKFYVRCFAMRVSLLNSSISPPQLLQGYQGLQPLSFRRGEAVTPKIGDTEGVRLKGQESLPKPSFNRSRKGIHLG
jgi:hypothetical protein